MKSQNCFLVFFCRLVGCILADGTEGKGRLGLEPSPFGERVYDPGTKTLNISCCEFVHSAAPSWFGGDVEGRSLDPLVMMASQ
jgi:hypothetical protein